MLELGNAAPDRVAPLRHGEDRVLIDPEPVWAAPYVVARPQLPPPIYVVTARDVHGSTVRMRPTRASARQRWNYMRDISAAHG
jgi:hypothetical protein